MLIHALLFLWQSVNAVVYVMLCDDASLECEWRVKMKEGREGEGVRAKDDEDEEEGGREKEERIQEGKAKYIPALTPTLPAEQRASSTPTHTKRGFVRPKSEIGSNF